MINAAFVRKVFGIFLAITLFFGFAPDGLTKIQAQARPLTPEASAYDVDKPTTYEMGERMKQEKSRTNLKRVAGESTPAEKAAENAAKNTKGAFQRTADDVREKLNLDEPVPQSTKEFINDVKEKVTNPLDR